MSSLVLGIDIGTTSVSVVAIDADGRLVSSATLTHGAAVSDLPVGHAEQAPALLWQTTQDALRQVMDNVGDREVTAIGVTGQMHSTLLLNENGQPCSNVITWQDKRAVVHERDGDSLFASLLSRVSPEAMSSTGCRLAPGYMGTCLLYTSPSPRD